MFRNVMKTITGNFTGTKLLKEITRLVKIAGKILSHGPGDSYNFHLGPDEYMRTVMNSTKTYDLEKQKNFIEEEEIR